MAALAGVSLWSLAAPAYAQNAAAEEGTDDEVIIVQARRRDEAIQDVPMVVQAVTAQELNKLNIREFQDVQTLVPGLSLAQSANGIGVQTTLRGIAFDVNASGNNGTVEFYMNDAPISAGILFQSMFDVAQIEVLRGPQGTLRGRASPSGSITVTTRKPDLSEAGG
jgi:iron complex outermembrane receptor protein